MIVTGFAARIALSAAGAAPYLIAPWRSTWHPFPLARRASCVRGMVSWARYPFYEIDVTDDGYSVYILDARYVRRRTTGFGSASVAVGLDLVPRCGGE